MLAEVEERFKEELERLCPRGKLVLAVSGGGDSVALMHLVKAAGREAVVAHLDHGLRETSAADAEFVKKLAEELGFPVRIERVDVAEVARKRGENLEAAAREVRYGFLSRVAREVGAECILTAHTANDQAETVLHQLFSGTARSLGVRKRRGRVVRPLLWARREELRRYLAEKGIPWREDETNLDTRRSRAYLRHRVLPLVEAHYPGAVPALSRFAAARQEEEAWLEEEASRLLLKDPRFFVPAYRALPLKKAPAPLRKRALRQALAAAGVRPEAEALEELEAVLFTGKKASLKGGVLAREYQGALFLLPPLKRPEGCRYRKDLRLKGGKRLAEFFRERGVPPELRPYWPLECEGDEVVRVEGLFPEPEEDRHLRRTLFLAKRAAKRGEVPIGAVLVKEGEVVAEAHNRVEETGDPTAHAELLALKEAIAKGVDPRGAEVYVSLEPCPMCYGALAEAGVARLYYAAENEKMGAFTVHRLKPPFSLIPGRFSAQSAKILSGFFARLRSEGCRSG